MQSHLNKYLWTWKTSALNLTVEGHTWTNSDSQQDQRRRYKKDKTPQVYGNFVNIRWTSKRKTLAKIPLRLKWSATNAGKFTTWLRHANGKPTRVNATGQIPLVKTSISHCREYSLQDDITVKQIRYPARLLTSQQQVSIKDRFNELNGSEDTSSNYPSFAEHAQHRCYGTLETLKCFLVWISKTHISNSRC